MLEAVFSAFYLGLYDVIKLAVAGGREGERLPIHLVAAASATTGAIAWVASYPFDCVKSVQQAQPAGSAGAKGNIEGAARAVWRSGGWSAFYRGVGPSTLRAILVASSRLVAYEHVKAANGWK